MKNFTKIQSCYKILPSHYRQYMFYSHVKYCPICGYKFKNKDFNEEEKLHTCQKCGFHFYHNMVPTNSAIIPKAGEPNTVLLTKRNQNPHKGKYDTPGGFFKYGEDVEKGIKRELMEELGLKIQIKKIFTVGINDYKYQQYHYKHTTIYFITESIDKLPKIVEKEENSEVIFFNLDELDKKHDMLAFEADYRALKRYKATL